MIDIDRNFELYQKERLEMLVEKKRGVTPQKVVDIYKKHGTIITIEEAKIILELLYNFAKLAVYQEVNNYKSK